MSRELAAQKEKLERLFSELQALRGKRAGKSKRYHDLEILIRQETDIYNAMLVASDRVKE